MVLATTSGVTLIESMPCSNQELREFGIVRRRLTTDSDLATRAFAAADHHRTGPFYCGLRSSNRWATDSESRSTPNVSCVRSLEPMEKPSKIDANSSA